MFSFIRRHHRPFFFLSWLLVNLIQAYGTELIDDEAYYWIYSLYPAWGYFDHPPMIGLLIKAGYSLFESEFGVRLFVVILNTITIYLISLLTARRDDRLFYCIALSIGIAQIGGIIAVPDVPLLFFVTIFFLAYTRFADRMNLINTILLGISIALMLYTKYHGILVVFFTLLSNPRLFTRFQTYIVGAISILLFLPHIYWQYTHAFPSVQYHLFERSSSAYRLSFTLDYIGAQLILAGPLMGWLLIWAALRFKTTTALDRALKYTLAGFYLFFLVSTLKGRVEANWTIPAFVALIVLSHHFLRNEARMRKWLYRSVPLTLAVILLARIYMIVSSEYAARIAKSEFHQNRETADIVARKASGLPVVFTDSYQRASKYWFYQKDPVVGLNTPYYRRNNFNFWPVEDSFFRKQVFVVGDFDPVVFKDPVVAPRLHNMGSTIVPFYYSFMKVEFSKVSYKLFDNRVRSSFHVKVPEKYLHFFQESPYDTASIQLALLANDSIWYFPSSLKLKQITQSSSEFTVDFPVNASGRAYEARLGISSGVPGKPSLNSPGSRLGSP